MSNQQLFGMTPSELDEILHRHTTRGLTQPGGILFYGFVVMAQLVVTQPLNLQMVVILQLASRRPFSMLPVTIFTVMMNNCQQDAKSSYFLPF